MYACRKDFQQDAAPALENSEQPAERSTTAEIETFVDSIPDTFINRQQRVLALMTYEEIKRRNPTASNHGRPLWPATHTLPLQPNGTRLSLTPLVISQDGQHDLAAYLAVEADSIECRYWIFSPMPPDSLTSASDRDGETPDGLSTCYQDCMGCPFPCGPAPNQMDHFNCLIGCILGLSGWSPFSGQVYSTDSYWQVHVSGSTPTDGFTNQGFLNNENGTGNNTGNNSGGGNGNLSNYNFTQTAYDVYDKYFDCLAANPDISTAVYNKLYTPNGTMHCLSPFIDEALGMLCEEAQGVNITAAQFEEEFERAVGRFYGIAKGIEGYVFSACGSIGEVINFALQNDLTAEQFETLFLNEYLFQQVGEISDGLNLSELGVSWLVENAATVPIIHDFLVTHDFNNSSTSIGNTAIVNNLVHITEDDLSLLYENADIYSYYLQYLSGASSESEENKLAALRTVMLAPTNPISNLALRLECFNITSNSNFDHKVSIYVNQPVANSDASADSKEKAGHTWLTLEQDMGGGNIITLSIGLYPQNFATPCKPNDYGAYNDDQGQPFDVSVTWPVSAYSFNILLENLKNQPSAPPYNLSSYNCSTFAVEKLNMLGMGIPETNVLSLPGHPLSGACEVDGLAPGRLGQDLRNTYTLPPGATRNTTGGHGPTSTCQ